MSISSSEEMIPIRVSATEPAAEVMIIGSDLRRLRSDVGRLNSRLEPGLYKLKWVVGSAVEERLIEVPEILPSGLERLEFTQEPLAFASAAPLAGTSTFDEAQAEVARAESRNVHRKSGKGSQIFLFVRDSKFTRDATSAKPWAKVSLQGFSHLAGPAHWRPEIACACLSVEVDEGSYVLSVDTSVWGTLQMSVYAAEGWQTQVFLDLRDFQRTDSARSFESRRADLDRASVFMARLVPNSDGKPRGGFDPESPALRTSELLRQGIERRRPLLRSGSPLRQEVKELLAREAPDPMVGIYALHLLLQEGSGDTEWSGPIRKRLHELKLDNHPDLRAAELVLEGLSDHPDLRAAELVPKGSSKDDTFERPPMLLQSWQRIVEASVRKIDLVPAGFLAFDISTQIVRGGAWLIWREKGSSGIRRQNRRARQGRQPFHVDLLEGLEVLAKGIPREGRALGYLAESVLSAIETETSARQRPSAPEDLARRLVGRLGLPAAFLEDQVSEILRKLGWKRPAGGRHKKAKTEP